MHLAPSRFALQHRASSISRPSVDSCLRSDHIGLMDASSLSAKRDGDGGNGGGGGVLVGRGWVVSMTGGPAQRQYVRLYFISSEF